MLRSLDAWSEDERDMAVLHCGIAVEHLLKHILHLIFGHCWSMPETSVRFFMRSARASARPQKSTKQKVWRF